MGNLDNLTSGARLLLQEPEPRVRRPGPPQQHRLHRLQRQVQWARVTCHVSVVTCHINRIAEVLSEDLQLVTLVSCVVRCDGRSHCVLTPALCRRVSCRWWAWCSPPASSLATAARWPGPGRGKRRRRGRRRW